MTDILDELRAKVPEGWEIDEIRFGRPIDERWLSLGGDLGSGETDYNVIILRRQVKVPAKGRIVEGIDDETGAKVVDYSTGSLDVQGHLICDHHDIVGWHEVEPECVVQLDNQNIRYIGSYGWMLRIKNKEKENIESLCKDGPITVGLRKIEEGK